VSWPLDPRFKLRENAAVLDFIARQNPSAHDEASTALADAASGLSDVARYCPDKHAYAYFVVHTRANRIFGIAYGMSSVAFALPPAIAHDGRAATEIGDGWVVFGLGSDLRSWCKRAHDHAVSRVG
jgi:hypothetical protein